MKLLKKKDEKKTEQEKVAERREEVLATGRKFKYPLQWTRHRIVVNTVLISVVAIAMILIGVWLALYRFGMTDDILFRITKIVPVSAASIDAKSVAFSDYLMFYRSSITSIERQSSGQFDQESLDNLRNDYKRLALNEAENYAYALKLANELNVTVSNEEIKTEFERHQKIGGIDRSEEGFIKIINDNFGLSKKEYERMLYLTLMRAKVEALIDENANEVAKKVEKMLAENGNNFQAVAEALGEAVIYEDTGGLVDSKNIDGGRATEATKLEAGKVSERFISTNGDGYYFVKLVDKTDTEVNFVSLKIPFMEFSKRAGELRDEGKVTEFIKIETRE